METPKSEVLIIPKVKPFSFVAGSLVNEEASRQGVYVANVGDGILIILATDGEIYRVKADGLSVVKDEDLIAGTGDFVNDLRKANPQLVNQ